MGPGASGSGVSTATVPRSAPGPGVSLHAYDIAVLVVYFVFVIGVGVWVSSLEVGGWQGRQRPALICGRSWTWGRGGQKAGMSGKHRVHCRKTLMEDHPLNPSIER